MAGSQAVLEKLGLGTLADSGSAQQNEAPGAKPLLRQRATLRRGAFEPSGAIGFIAHEKPPQGLIVFRKQRLARVEQDESDGSHHRV
jgi:hypothetical protein